MTFNRKMNIIPLLACAIMLAPNMLHNSLGAQNTTSQTQFVKRPIPQISMIGEAKVNVAPDLAMVDLAVLREAKTARQALTENNEAMAKVIAAMKEAGIQPKDLQTSGLSIQPKYVYHRPKKGEEQKPPRIVGYSVSNNLAVRIRDLSIVGEVLDKSVTLGVNNGGHIRFGNDDPKIHIAKARAEAMKDAITKAKTILDVAGARLGPIISINENSHAPRPMPMARGKMMAEAIAADAVPIEAGQNSYSVTISVNWEILQ